MNKPIKIKDGIYWVGAIDYDIKVFDVVMETEYGTTYNSYIYKTSEKTVLIEVVKEQFFDEFLERLSEVTNPAEIDYVIINHAEPDHTGSLYKLLKLNPNIKVFASLSGIRNLKNIMNVDFNHEIVKDKDTLSIGDGKEIEFISAPFLHWPDSIFTYAKDDEILFTCDFLGAHYATDLLFKDLLKNKEEEDYMISLEYYYNVIIKPFNNHALAALDKIKELNINMICPGHGMILREDIKKYISLYKKWSMIGRTKANLVVIPYVSCYGYTEILAKEIGRGVESAGFNVKLYDIILHDMKEILDSILLADGILVGSPTLVGDALPPVWELLISLNPFINNGLKAGAFGSYGWSGEAVRNIEDRFKQLRFKVPIEGYKILFKPSDDEIKNAFDFGKAFGEAIK